MRRICFLLALLLAGAASAADEDPQEQLTQAAATESGAGWIFGGGVAVTQPGYVGDKRQVTPLPLVFFHYGRFFFAGFAAGYMLDSGEHYRFSLGVQPWINRLDPSDSPQLAGMQKRRWTLAGGANLELFGDWGRVNLNVAHDLLGRNDGTAVNAGYQYSFHAGTWGLTPGFGLRWQDADLTDYYYGVLPAEARPGRPAYSPGAATNPYVSFGVSTPLSEHWQFRGNIQYLRFASTIHASPIVDRSGSTTVFIGFVYNERR